MARLHILDTLSLPGRPDRPNEDAFGVTETSAFVIDGATGLGQNLLVAGHDSDAAWLAAFAKVHFEEMADRGLPVAEMVRQVNTLAARIVQYSTSGLTVAAWQLPIAGFSMVGVQNGAVAVHALGDCTVMACDGEYGVFAHTAISGQALAEQAAARQAVAAAGGLAAYGSLVAHDATLQALRASRATCNTPGGLWTLGTNPAAADNVATASITLRKPFVGLVMSDGFSALTDKYGRYAPAELVRIAEGNGLAALGEELRHIETVEDPDGFAYPRFKVSDDATAILFTVE